MNKVYVVGAVALFKLQSVHINSPCSPIRACHCTPQRFSRLEGDGAVNTSVAAVYLAVGSAVYRLGAYLTSGRCLYFDYGAVTALYILGFQISGKGICSAFGNGRLLSHTGYAVGIRRYFDGL